MAGVCAAAVPANTARLPCSSSGGSFSSAVSLFEVRFLNHAQKRSSRAPRNFSCRCDSSPSPSSPSSRPPSPPDVDVTDESMTTTLEKSSTILGIPAYGLCAALGAVGFVETSYLTFIKLTGGEALCPVGGGSCGDVLNSDYAVVYGIPLPLFGVVAYGAVAALGLQLTGKNIFSALAKSDARMILLGLTTSMATASACFLYILSTKLAGASCSYCLFSAALSFTLFFCTLKDFGLQEIQKVVGLQLALAGIVIAALSSSYGSVQPQLQGSSDFELEPFETEITTKSSPFAISLAKHLHSIGAKMYGAFWCSHCIEQKQMFGQEAMKTIDYTECFPNGAGKGRKITQECADIGIQGFPTWIINGEVISGEQDLQTLAKISGFIGEGFDPSLVPDKQ